eukprot:jgi/Phyca11/20087/fgenesh1_pg.PHYCAscaffold_57_\
MATWAALSACRCSFVSGATDEAARDGASAPTPAPVAGNTQTDMENAAEEKSTAIAHERGDGNYLDKDQMGAVDNVAELMTLLRGVAGRLERLEESQTKLEKKLDGDEAKRARNANQPPTPAMNASLFDSGLGRGNPMHIDYLGSSPQTPLTITPRRPAYVMERMLQTFKATITPGHAVKLFTSPKGSKRDPRKKNFAQRAQQGVIVGIGEEIKGYRVYLPKDKIAEKTDEAAQQEEATKDVVNNVVEADQRSYA